MECNPKYSDEVVELLLEQGHVTTRRPHHGKNLAYDLLESYYPDGLVGMGRDEYGTLTYNSNFDLGSLCFAIPYYDFARQRVLSTRGQKIYKLDNFKTVDMTYLRDLSEGIDPEALINCIAAYDIYALLLGPDASARFVSGVDEICSLTTHKIHCTYGRGAIDNRFANDRLSPDEQQIEWMVNLLKLRSFFKNPRTMGTETFPWLYDGLANAEKWLGTMTIEIDGRRLDESDYEYVSNIDISRVTIGTTLGVMLDTQFYDYINEYGVDVDRRRDDLKFLWSLGILEEKGFRLAQLNSSF